MVPVATDHAADVVDGDQLPWLVTDVLPARNLFEHEQADLVTTVEEVARLRIVRCADDIAMQFVAQNIGIAPLSAGRHRLTDEGKGLMTIEPSELDDLAVERETTRCEHRFAKANAARVGVENVPGREKPNVNAIKLRTGKLPELDPFQPLKPYSVPSGILGRLSAGMDGSRSDRIRCGVRVSPTRMRDRSRVFGDGAIAVTKLDFESEV